VGIFPREQPKNGMIHNKAIAQWSLIWKTVTPPGSASTRCVRA
jgi:hypothetical protein